MAAITIGSAAIDRDGAAGAGLTYLAVDNPADDTGKLTAFELWTTGDSFNNCKIGTFTGSSTSYTPNDYESIGSVNGGSKQTFSGLDCAVTIGDLIGIFWDGDNGLERTNAGGGGVYYKADDQFDAGTQTYGFSSGRILSLYGTGITAVASTVTTEAVSSIAPITATGNGTIVDDGGETPSAWGVCVDTNVNPDTTDDVFAGSGAGAEEAFTAAITGLTMGTLYHVRAYATNTVGTSYGADVEFTTTTLTQAAAGTLTSAGATNKTTSKHSTDSLLTISGALVGVHSIFRSVAGVMASAGALVKIPTKMFAGALTSSSTLTRNIYKNCAGTLTSASTLTRNIWKYVAGAVTPTGAIAHSKIFVKAIAGVLTSSATLGKTLVAYIQACAGAVTPTGALTKYTKLYNACAGTLTSAGAVTKQTFLNCAGVVWTLAGTVSRNIYKEVAGILTPTGALSKVALFFKECAGTITPTGAITKFIYKYVAAGIITPTGTITKWVRIKLLGTVTSAGTVSKFTQKTIGGTLSLIGRLVAWIHGPAIVCTLTFEEELDTTLTFEEELETTLYFEGG